MNVCLLRPPSPELLNDRIDPPIGLLYLGTSLKEHGYHVEILDFAGGENPEIPADADIYGFTLFTTSYTNTLEIRDRIRDMSEAPIIVGGPHAQALPVATSKDFDYVFIGESEHTLPLLIEPMVKGSLEERIIEAKAPLNLDELAFNDYSLVDLGSYNRVVSGEIAVSILSGRGCPWKCKYCYTAALEIKVRMRSPEHVMGELYKLDEEYGIDAIRFIDDNFLMNKTFLRGITPMLKNLGKPYRVYGRAQDLTEEIVDLLADSGCVMIGCGIESGSQKMHELMNTKKYVEKMKEGVRLASKAGIKIRAGLIVGFPGETWETVRESVDELKEMDIDSYNLFNFIPLPGTDPFIHPEKYGITWLSENWKDYYMLQGENEAAYAFEHVDLDKETLAEMRQYMISELDKVFLPSLKDVEFK
ncbi:radical SAM protein [Candidatus Woesearchaeota archaeon]|nr:radical SAM protein [Candidatus Woesearchaeota archaeon]